MVTDTEWVPRVKGTSPPSSNHRGTFLCKNELFTQVSPTSITVDNKKTLLHLFKHLPAVSS